jgi:hypothetical protein
LFDDRSGIAQLVNTGRAALLGLRAGRERQRPKHQHRSTKSQCKLFHSIFLFAPRERTYSNLMNGSMAKKQKSSQLVHMNKPTVNKLP